MANTTFKLRRSSVAGKAPNTSTLSIGELAINLTDRKLYSSDGTNIFETGSNLTSLSVFSDIKIGNSSVNSSINSTALSVKSIVANGGIGTANQILVSNGTGIYWKDADSVSGAGRVYSITTASNNQNTFTTSSPFTPGLVDVYFNGVHLSNSEYLEVNSTAIQLTENATNGAIVELSGWVTINTLVAGSNTTIQFNDSGYINSSANFTFNKTSEMLVVGNSSINTQINSTSLTVKSIVAKTLDVQGTYSLAGANALSQTLTDGATINWNTALGQIATVTLGGNRTMAAPTNLKIGTYVLNVLQDGTGSRTITWNGVFKWPAGTAPVLTTTASRRDIIFFYSDGTNLYGSFLPDVR